MHDLLIIGIGNDGRNDDGLGWAFLNHIEQEGRFADQLLYRYQLQIDDAETISHVQHVVFVDACRSELSMGFHWQTCAPEPVFEYTSHQLAPQAVLYLCQTLYRATPQAHILLIQGDSWNLEIGLSATAQHNLKQALHFFSNPGSLFALSQQDAGAQRLNHA